MKKGIKIGSCVLVLIMTLAFSGVHTVRHYCIHCHQTELSLAENCSCCTEENHSSQQSKCCESRVEYYRVLPETLPNESVNLKFIHDQLNRPHDQITQRLVDINVFCGKKFNINSDHAPPFISGYFLIISLHQLKVAHS